MKLSKIVNIINGSTPSTSNPSFWDGDINWITPKDMSLLRSRYISSGNRNITKLGYSSCSTTLVPAGTVLLTSRAPVGYVAIASNPLCTNQGFKSMVCDENLIKPLYLYYWIFKNKEYLESIAGGSTFKELSKEQLGNIDIVLPSLNIQQHIVNTIGTIDDLIELTSKKIAHLEQLGIQLYVFKKETNYELLKTSSLNIRYGESVPKSKRRNGDVPLYASNGRTDFIDKYNAYENTVIFGCRGTLGNVFFSKKECFVLNTAFYITNFENYGGLYFALKFNKGFTLYSSGAAQPQITIDAIKDAKIRIPLDEDLNYLLNCISLHEEILDKLKKIKGILLSKYF